MPPAYVTSIEVRRPDGSSIAVDVAGDRKGSPVLLCHGLADSRVSARLLAAAARELGLSIIAPDRPGTGDTDYRRLERLADWVDDARLVLDGCGTATSTAVVGISGGAAFAAACAGTLAERVHALVLISPLGDPAWGTRGMAIGQRLSLAVARRAPAFGGWFLDRLAILARRSPSLFLRIAATELPEVDRLALTRADAREPFLAGYLSAFRRGSRGVAQDLRLLTQAWGVALGAVRCPTWIHAGDADTTVPREHARRLRAEIAAARLHVHSGHGHFSLLPDEAAAILAPVARARTRHLAG